MYQDFIKTHFKKILLTGVLALLVIAGTYKLNKNQEATKEEIFAERKTVGYAARAITVKALSFSDAYTYRGTVEAGKLIALTAETDGKVVYSKIEKGASIAKGMVMVRVDPATRASSNQMNRDTYEKARSDYNKLKELLATGNASGMEVENARLQMQNAAAQLNISKKQVMQTAVLAPEAGTVIDKKINTGEYVTPGTPLGTLACLNEVRVNVFVQETEVATLKVGSPVTLKADAYPGVFFTGKIAAVIPVASAAKTFPIEIRVVNNQHQKLLAGMNVSVVFNAAKRSKALVIPRIALAGNQKQPSVYVIRQSARPVLTPIVLGKEYDNYLGVTSGLKAGDTIMTSGLLNVEPGKKITALTVQN